MSTQENTSWLEAALENFDEALEEGDVAFAKAIIADVQEKGFNDEVRQLNVRLRVHVEQSDKDNG